MRIPENALTRSEIVAIHFCLTPAITTAVQRIYFASVTFSDERTNEVIIQQELLEGFATGESLYWAILDFFLFFKTASL